MSLPPIHSMPFIGANALYKIASLDPVAGDPFGTSKKGRDVHHPLGFAPINEVFGDVTPAEAMFVCYRRRNSGPLPRLTKATEGRIDLVCDFAAFDVDLNAQFGEKGKLSWAKLGEERTQIMEERIEALLDLLRAENAAPVCYYRSKNGLRFVHLFHEAVPTAGLELAYKRLAPLYARVRIQVDSSCFDWTRCFKVPRCILEDGTQTDTQPWFRLEWFPHDITLVTAEELTAVPTVGYAGEVLAETRLEVSHAREAVFKDGGLTPDGLLASHAIRGDGELHAICFDDSTPFKAPEGTRHTELTRLVGRLTKRCVGQPWASEQFLYALLAPKIQELGSDEEWLDKLWGMICDYIAQDRTELTEKNASVKAVIAAQAVPPPPTALQVFCDGIRSWFPDANGLPNEEVVNLTKIARLAIATSQETNNNYLLQPNGYYSPYPVSPDKIALKVRETRMEWLVPLDIELPGKKVGETRIAARTWQQFLSEDARTFASTRMLCVHKGNYLTKDESDNTQFIISPFWLRGMEPLFNQQVETWLQLAAEDGRAESLILALAYLLAFQFGPTAAVALIGPRSVGKKLIATGLAECINTLQCCSGRALVSRFNSGLTKSPIIWVDEGLPKGKDGIDFADTFRNLVTGGKQTVEPKGKEIFEVAGVHRVLITANNYEAIAALGEGGPRTQDDMDAISERLTVFLLQKRAADYLGSLDTTGWIAGDNGSPSQFIVARHLLWHLFHTVQWENGQPKKMGRRLLYEGTSDGLVQQTIDGADENVPEIACLINDMIRAGQCHLRNGAFYVNPEPLKHKSCNPQGTLKIKPSEYRRAVRALAWDQHNTSIDGIECRWLVVNPRRLADVVSLTTTLAPALEAASK